MNVFSTGPGNWGTSMAYGYVRGAAPGAIAGAIAGAIGGEHAAKMSQDKDVFGASDATSLTLVPKDLQSQLSRAASEIKVRHLDPAFTRDQQSNLALEISGKAITGLEGAALSFAAKGGKATAEVVSSHGSRQQLPVETEALFSDCYLIGLPDGTKLSVSPDSIGSLMLNRTSQHGASLCASLSNEPGQDGSHALVSLVASADHGTKNVSLNADGKGGMSLGVHASELPFGFGLSSGPTLRSASESGINPLGGITVSGLLPLVSGEPKAFTAHILGDAARRVHEEAFFSLDS